MSDTIPVTVDDEHAQPVTGYLLRLPGRWLVRCPWTVDGDTPDFYTLSELCEAAIYEQGSAAQHGYPTNYDLARWWAEAYRVALKAEREQVA